VSLGGSALYFGFEQIAEGISFKECMLPALMKPDPSPRDRPAKDHGVIVPGV